jgi:hypothetical protein
VGSIGGAVTGWTPAQCELDTLVDEPLAVVCTEGDHEWVNATGPEHSRIVGAEGRKGKRAVDDVRAGDPVGLQHDPGVQEPGARFDDPQVTRAWCGADHRDRAIAVRDGVERSTSDRIVGQPVETVEA